jgi:hypothetical protein
VSRFINGAKLALFVLLLVAFTILQSRANLAAARQATPDHDGYSYQTGSTPGAQELYPPTDFVQADPNAY